MSILLTADLHLTDNPNDEYRWAIFDHITDWIKGQQLLNNACPTVYILGDLTDRKDRHSAALVNRVTNEITKLVDCDASIWILMGNHDKPLNGPPFWQFLDYIRPGTDVSSGVSFITRPHGSADLVLLPYSDNPQVDWAEIDFKGRKAAFIHQTVTGATGNNGIILENSKMLSIPRSVKVYSGDIHTSQKVGNVLYVGSPHPVNFGDDYPPQMLELDADYTVSDTIVLKTIQKLMLRIDSPADLKAVKTRPRDQARVVCRLPLADVDRWPAMQDEIIAWAARKDVRLFSVEPEIESGTMATGDTEEIEVEANDPEYILRLFADAEEIDDRMFQMGISLLKEAVG